jgi:apolipoprotein N-acyltransferase
VNRAEEFAPACRFPHFGYRCVMPTRFSGILRSLACLGSGALLSLAFAPVAFGPLVWIALLPMVAVLWTVKGRRRGLKGFGFGWLAGFAFFALNLKWLNTVSWVGALILPAYLALFFGAFGAFAATWGRGFQISNLRSQIAIPFINAAVWGGLEWLRGWLLTGFGWNGLGVALHGASWLAQAADLFGVTGLSLVVMFVGLLGLQALREFFLKKRKPWLEVGTIATVFVALSVYGAIRLATVGKGESVTLRALLIQLNIPQDAARPLWEPEEIHMAYEEETGKALDALRAKGVKADWVIWPESALTGRLLRMQDDSWAMWDTNIDTIERVRERDEFTLMMGLTELEGEAVEGGFAQKEKGRAWNSLVVLPAKSDLMTFRKHHLVFFGETIPFADQMPLFKKIYEQQAGVEYGGSYSSGESLNPVPVKVGDTEVGVIPSVCFEDTVGRLERKFVRPGPQVIVNITNDGWFKESEAAEQQFHNAIFRAIELRRPMIRCANTGVTAAVSTTGQTLQKLVDDKGSHFTRGSLLVELPIPLKPAFSLYALSGDWPVIGLGLLGFAIGFKSRGAKTKES